MKIKWYVAVIHKTPRNLKRIICVFFGHKFAATTDDDAWYRECERCHEVLP